MTSTIGDLLSCLNHDIRTSMNGVSGMLALLLDSGLTAAQRRLAADARQCADNLMVLLENLIDFSMFEAGSFTLAQDCFDLREMLQAACDQAPAAASGKKLALRVQLPPALMLLGDAARLRSVIGGLLDAMAASGAEGQISVEASAARQDGDRCRICVTIGAPGTGPGGQMPRTVPDLLDLPELADPAAIRMHGRIGLELALCKRLARLMNGRIEVHDQAGAQVLRFSVELPCVPDAIAGVRALLMVQHAADSERLAAQLRASGMRVDAFDGVSAALAALAQAASGQDPYRIAILGDKVQGMDCEVLGAAIKADAACRDVLLVALSAWPRRHDEPDLAQAGFCAVIAAPPQQEQVQGTVRTLCEAIAGGRDPGFVTPDFITPAFGGRRILVADDNPVNREVAQRMAQNLGCAVDVAADGEQALAMHAAQPYDLILMDCQMPQLDGYQATVRIRALEGAAGRVPVIAVTACAAPGEREKCLACGMDDFIAKPVRPHLLAAAIGRWLGAAPEKAPQPCAQVACADELDVVRDMFGPDFAELARLYQKDSPPRIAALQQAGAAQDYPHVAKVAHALSGSSVSIGATGLSALCKELELRAKAGAVEDFTARLAAIEAEYDRIGARLRAMVRPKAEPA